MAQAIRIHASCVAAGYGAALLKGAAGSGKSALAQSLMALGGRLVADDRTLLELRDGWPCATAPDELRGLIEARGVGLLVAAPQLWARVTLVVDLDRSEWERLPAFRHTEILGRRLPMLLKVDGPQFAPAILECLRGRRFVT